MELKRAIRSAYTNVPFYKKLLEDRYITPESIKTLEDISMLPVLSKKTFRDYPIEETLDQRFLKENNFIWNQTSGSTGMPFRYALSSFYIFYKSPRYLRYSEFCKYRFLTWKGTPISFIANKMRVAELGVKYPRPNLLFFPINELNKNPEAVLSSLAEFKPDLLEGVPTIVLETARVYAKNKHRFNISIPFINTHGEQLMEGERGFLKDTFGAEVYSRYGTGETGVIGVECQEHDSYHLLEESFFVEVVDEKYQMLPDGSHGHILVSFFYNDVMPFIRYETGDYGVVLPDFCRCGVPGRRIKIDGRIGEIVSLKGRNIGVVQFEMILSYFSKSVLRFQVVKKSPDTLEIRIIPTSSFRSEVALKLQREFDEAIGVMPTISLVEDIPYTTRGKTKIFIDETVLGSMVSS